MTIDRVTGIFGTGKWRTTKKGGGGIAGLENDGLEFGGL